MSKTQIGPWLGFINSGRFKHKGFEKNHPVIILSVGDNGYGPACKVIGLYEWWKHQDKPDIPSFNAIGGWVKASAISIVNQDGTGRILEVGAKQERFASWPTVGQVGELTRMSQNWSSEFETGFASSYYALSQEAFGDLMVEQGFLRDKTKEDAQVKFYGQVVRNTDKAMLVSVGPDKEEHWFPKSQCDVIGYLTNRPEQYVLTTKAWQLKSKVGDELCETFVKAQKAIDRHGTMRNPMGVGEDGEIKSPGLGI